MKCDQVLAILSRFQDGECDDEEQLQIFSHLNECIGCHREWERMERVLEAMDRVDGVIPAPNFNAMTMAKIKNLQVRSPFPLPSFIYSFVFVLFFLLGLILVQPFETEKTTKKKDLTMVQILMESQNLNQFYTQNKTINWLYKGGTNEK
jgi:predicted anti-sigma-YlaC factor YlaD